jgi:hypothetical protein
LIHQFSHEQAYILFGDKVFWDVFEEAFAGLMRLRPVNSPIFLNANMFTAFLANGWVDGLQAYFPGVLVLVGDLRSAMELHEYFAQIWFSYSAMPERFNWQQRVRA